MPVLAASRERLGNSAEILHLFSPVALETAVSSRPWVERYVVATLSPQEINSIILTTAEMKQL